VAVASGVTEPCTYVVDDNLDSYAKAELDFIASKVGDKPANVLEIRDKLQAKRSRSMTTARPN
jgi:ribose transport system substrate-binding protein